MYSTYSLSIWRHCWIRRVSIVHWKTYSQQYIQIQSSRIWIGTVGRAVWRSGSLNSWSWSKVKVCFYNFNVIIIIISVYSLETQYNIPTNFKFIVSFSRSPNEIINSFFTRLFANCFQLQYCNSERRHMSIHLQKKRCFTTTEEAQLPNLIYKSSSYIGVLRLG